MQVTVRVEWDMGHRLPSHSGKCRHLHGHRYAAEVTLSGPVVHVPHTSADGMVADFGVVKAIVKAEAEKLDHRFMLCAQDPVVRDMAHLPGVILVPYVPTAERIAEAFLASCRQALSAEPGAPVVTGVRLYETPTAWVDAR